MRREPTRLAPRLYRLALPMALAFLAGLLMLLVAVAQTRAMAAAQAQARAQLVADSMAASLGNALLHGVPLRALVGVEALFVQGLAQSADVRSIELRSADGRLLASRATADGDEPLESVVADVRLRSDRVAQVVLRWREPPMGARLLLWAVPVATWLAGILLLACEVARWVWIRGVLRREQLLRLAGERLHRGDMGWRFPPVRDRGLDPRINALAAQVRHVNELFVRIERLALSLSQTEPDADRQAGLSRELASARGCGVFRGERVQPLKVHDPLADARFGGLLLGLLAVLSALAWAVAGAASPSRPQAGALALASVLGAATVAVALALRLRRPQAQARAPWRRAFATGAGLGWLVLGPALALPWADLVLALPDHWRLPLQAGQVLACGLALACLVAMALRDAPEPEPAAGGGDAA